MPYFCAVFSEMRGFFIVNTVGVPYLNTRSVITFIERIRVK